MYLIFLYILMAVGLSVDAFSLAVIYGMNKISTSKALTLSLLVGIFHFVMPHLGSIIGFNLLTNLVDKANLLVAIVFIVIAIEMLVSIKDKEKELQFTKIHQLIFFACTVSLDSFTVGIVLSIAHEKILLAGLIFSITSFVFTYFGIKLGLILNKKHSNKAIIIGALILIMLALKYLFFA